MTQKKKLFVFQFDHSIDLITNSSSELFVFKQDTKASVEELVVALYPDYLDEYESVRCIDELSDDELMTLLYFMFDNYQWDLKIDTLMKPENRERLLKALDPKRNIFFLFSTYENPDFEKQELLKTVAKRYHLG